MEKKNILVLTGSPRRNGNSDRLADAFVAGALSKGHEVARFDAARKNIKGCIACKACWKRINPVPSRMILTSWRLCWKRLM